MAEEVEIKQTKTEIRILTEHDAKAFHALQLRATKDHPEAFGMAYEELLQRSVEDIVKGFREAAQTGNPLYFGAFDPALVGLVRLIAYGGIRLGHRGGLGGMYVAPEARGKGAGKAMLESAISHARDVLGLELITLSVTAGNETARKLYEAAGFRQHGVEPCGLKVGEQCYDLELMYLRLK
jgi:RimJ/RimL family protein N-acetyltransferase